MIRILSVATENEIWSNSLKAAHFVKYHSGISSLRFISTEEVSALRKDNNIPHCQCTWELRWFQIMLISRNDLFAFNQQCYYYHALNICNFKYTVILRVFFPTIKNDILACKPFLLTIWNNYRLQKYGLRGYRVLLFDSHFMCFSAKFFLTLAFNTPDLLFTWLKTAWINTYTKYHTPNKPMALWAKNNLEWRRAPYGSR